MCRLNRRLSAACTLAALLLGSTSPSTGAEARQRSPEPQAKHLLWRDPGPIAELDLSWSSDPARRPAPPFNFVEEDSSGTRPKVVVTDNNGIGWNVKLSAGPEDGEVYAEVAAGRLVWALGYFVEESYHVAEGTIERVGQLSRAAKGIGADGRFRAARFEKRPKEIVRTGEDWSFDRNPFVGSRELSGLMILMTMINNWDLGGTRNMTVLRAQRPDGAAELRYLVSDHGAAFGRMGRAGIIRQRTKWRLEDYQSQKFIDRVTEAGLDLNFEGDGAIDIVPLDHARWFAGLVAQLTTAQVRQAFEAAGATPAEVDGFSARFVEKIHELETAVSLQ